MTRAGNAADLDSVKEEHQAAVGAKCKEGPDGMCVMCDVEMSRCNRCNGVGYHAARCPESIVTPDFEACTAEHYNDMLEVIFPVGWCNSGFLVGEPWSHRTCQITGRYLPTYRAMVCRGETSGIYLQSTAGITVHEWRALNLLTMKIEPRD